MKITNILPVLFLLYVPIQLPAQKSWSLEECIKYAWDNNLMVKQKEISVNQSNNNVFQSKMDYLPSMNASVSHSMNWGRSVNMQDLQIVENKLSQSMSASLNASLTLFEGLQKTNNLKSKEVLLQISELDVKRTKNQLALQISKNYLEVMLAKEILKSADQSLASVEEQVKRTEKLVDAGSVAYSSLLEIQSQLATERVQVVSAKNQVNSALLTLRQLLDLSYDTHFDILTPDLGVMISEFDGESVDSLYELSRDLPEIQSALLNQKNSKLQLSVAKGASYPSVSFSAGYGTYYSDQREETMMDQFNENRNPSISFGLRIPIFNNWQTNTAIRNAHLNVKSAEIDLKTAEQTLFKEIQQANNDAIAYFEKYKASIENVKSMEESFRYVQQKFEIGVLNATDYTVAKTNLFKAMSDLLQAKYQFVFQLKVLDYYKGIPITL
ncbi:MAG TPA: TolC family protein [Bacteroidales bacterium]|nr:TolC family protein [Bacteroidales bacterium]HRT83102.1 TolC family protein [Bacteroidales bacterium]